MSQERTNGRPALITTGSRMSRGHIGGPVLYSCNRELYDVEVYFNPRFNPLIHYLSVPVRLASLLAVLWCA